jgi:DNA-binding transcriptional regulator YdaS (Cro superfamily)
MEALRRAIEIIGSQAELARRLGVKPQAFTDWLSGTRPLPPLRAAQIEKILEGKVKARELLPDFPWPESAQAA